MRLSCSVAAALALLVPAARAQGESQNGHLAAAQRLYRKLDLWGMASVKPPQKRASATRATTAAQPAVAPGE